MAEYIIDAALFTSREQAHERMQGIFTESEYLGESLDALHDVLTTLGKKNDPAAVTVKNLRAARNVLGSYAERLARVFAESALDNPYLRVTFTTDNT